MFYLAIATAAVAFLHAGLALAKVIAAKTKSPTDDKWVAFVEKHMSLVDTLINKLK